VRDEEADQPTYEKVGFQHQKNITDERTHQARDNHVSVKGRDWVFWNQGYKDDQKNCKRFEKIKCRLRTTILRGYRETRRYYDQNAKAIDPH
jgi:hypothetical protein